MILDFYRDKLTETAIYYLGIFIIMTTWRLVGEGINTCLICGCFRGGGDSRFGMIVDSIFMWLVAVPPKMNGFDNAEFFVGKAEEVLPREYEKNGVYADTIVVDPPRKGCDGKLLETMVKMAPKRIVYVSCDPATLARDLKVLSGEGYEVEKVCAVDQFSHSSHVETVVRLRKSKF